jgi:hypothetical protein
MAMLVYPICINIGTVLLYGKYLLTQRHGII